MKTAMKKKLSVQERDRLLETLAARFAKNSTRHPNMGWEDVEKRLASDAGKLWSLAEMENTGGEPDVVGRDKPSGEYIFFDCAAESPKGRRSLCYDDEALAARKEHKPAGSAIEMAERMGVRLLSEEQYRELQRLGEFDTKSSSWVLTPAPIRRLGGALFCDRRYDTVFVYHNGAESYYAARGFRAWLKV